MSINRYTLCMMPVYLVAGYLVTLSLPKHLQLPALTASTRERIAYYALQNGETGYKIAHLVYPKIERDTKAGSVIAGAYGSELLYKGRHKEVIEFFEKDLEITRKAYGDKNTRTNYAWLSLSIAYRDSGQYEKSIECANQVIKNCEGRPLCEEATHAYQKLIFAYSYMNKFELAVWYSEKLIALELAGGMTPIEVLPDFEILAYCYRDAGQFDKQAQTLARIAEIKKYKRIHPTLAEEINAPKKPKAEDPTLFDLVK